MVTLHTFYIGQKFGHLTLTRQLRPLKKRPYSARWRARCACGKLIAVHQSYLVRDGNPKTHCGCKIKTLKTIYNREYRIWLMMRKRCTDTTHVAYKYYGGRGIKVCDEWFDKENGFEKFFKALGAAPSTGHSIDRIDVDGNYTPGNVRWATAKQQAGNTQRTKAANAASSRGEIAHPGIEES